jgi:hypothetical protein
MRTMILLAVLHGVISISPIREFRPYPSVKCPRGNSLWWPSGKEFDNDKYAECIKPIAQETAKAAQKQKKIKDVSLRQRVARH